MAGDGTLLAWDDSDVQKMIKGNVKRIGDMTPVMKSFSEYLVGQTEERFKLEQSPDGKAWEPLSPITVKQKQRQGKIDKILQQDGYLRLVHPEADTDSAGIYSDRVYAAIHNRGGKAGAGHKVTIPKREFLGINEADIREFHETIKDWIILGKS